MKVSSLFVIAAFCIAACLSQSNSTEELHGREKRALKKSKGRFLSLPIPQKCLSRKFYSSNRLTILILFEFLGKFAINLCGLCEFDICSTFLNICGPLVMSVLKYAVSI